MHQPPILVQATAIADQGYTVSKVEFFDGATIIGTDTSASNSVYSVTWTNPSVGSHTITAKATAIKKSAPNQTATSAGANITVLAANVAPQVQLISPLTGTTFGYPVTTIPVRVDASDSDGTIARVDFILFDENTNVSTTKTDTESPYSVVFTPDPEGGQNIYQLSVVAYDNLGATAVAFALFAVVGDSIEVTGLAPAALSLAQGSSATLNVSVAPAPPTDTQVTLSSSDASVASVPTTFTIPAGHSAVSIPVTGLSPGIAQITALLNGSTASTQITVTGVAATPVSVVPALARLAVGASTNVAATISATQSSDATVTLSASPQGIVDIPPQVVVPAGQLSAIVPLAALSYGQVGFTATLNGGTASGGVSVVPPPASVMGLEPPQIAMAPGATSNFTVRLNSVQVTSTAVQLASSDPDVLQVPATVSVPQGASAASFTATAMTTGDAVITASVNDTSRTNSIHVTTLPPAVIAILPSPLPLQQGAAGSLTVELNAVQSGPTAVNVFNFDPAVAALAASVTIPAGAISSEVTAQALTVGTTQVTASLNGTSVSTEIQVATAAPVIASLSPATLSLPKGTPRLVRLSLSRAPNAVVVVTLVSSNPAVASVPGQVNVPAGALYVDFPVMANAQGSATITGSLGGTTAQTVVTITAAELVNLGIVPETPEVYVGSSVPFTATGTMTDGTAQDFTSVATWSSSNSTVGAVSTTGIASGQNPGQTSISAAFSFTAAETGTPVTVTASAVLTVKPPAALTLSTPTATLTVGETVTVTLATSDPAPSGGLLVTLSGGGSGAGTFPPTLTVEPQQTSGTFSFTASGAGSFSIAASASNRLPTVLTFTIASVEGSPQVVLQSPSVGAIIADDHVVVSGTWSGPSNTGITVNGVVAAISGNQFFATVPLVPGVNTITVVATVLGGNQTTATLSVSSSGPSPTRVTASSVQGLAPLTVSFTVSSDRAIQSVDGTFAPGSPFSVSPVTGPLSFTYGNPGSYEAVFNVRHTDGSIVSKALRIVVHDQAALDTMLKAEWQGFAQRLAVHDVAGAGSYLSERARQRYLPVLQALQDRLPSIAASFSELRTVAFGSRTSEFALRRTEPDGNNYLYLIYFGQGDDGIWRLESM